MTIDTQFFIAISSAIFVMALLASFIIYFMLLYRKKQEDFEWEREQYKKALLETEIEIKEQTLTNISRELHDNIGQIASLIKINLNLVNGELSEPDKAKVTDSIQLSKQLIKDVKALSVSLKSENLQRFGLINMISKDIKRYQSVGDLKIKFVSPEILPPLNSEVETILYRMSQEIFNNILKHANAISVIMSITIVDNSIIFKIIDDGIGFDFNTVEQGSGLSNINERCKMIGAQLKIESVPHKGTDIEINLETKTL